MERFQLQNLANPARMSRLPPWNIFLDPDTFWMLGFQWSLEGIWWPPRMSLALKQGVVQCAPGREACMDSCSVRRPLEYSERTEFEMWKHSFDLLRYFVPKTSQHFVSSMLRRLDSAFLCRIAGCIINKSVASMWVMKLASLWSSIRMGIRRQGLKDSSPVFDVHMV